MGTDFEEEINRCTFLLGPQKKKVVELYNKCDVEGGEINAEYLIDGVFESMLGFSISDLTASERVDLTNAVKDFLK